MMSDEGELGEESAVYMMSRVLSGSNTTPPALLLLVCSTLAKRSDKDCDTEELHVAPADDRLAFC